MLVSLSLLNNDPDNARRAREDDASIAALAGSMAVLGQLQPIIVRPADTADVESEKWLVTSGARRVAAARRLGWSEVEAVVRDDNPAIAISMAENAARKAMGAVDQWRAMAAICQEKGFTIERSAAALGLDLALAKRLALLGRMAPEIIDAIEADGTMPAYSQLRLIASAPHDVQIAAFGRARKDPVVWGEVAHACRCQRIPLSRAAFNVEVSGIAVEEDLFAEPGSDEQFTTTDITGFLNAQRAALAEKVKAGKGRYQIIEADPNGLLSNMLPKGWRRCYDREVPKRWRKDDPGRVFIALAESGYNIGAIEEVLAEPVAQPAKGKAAVAADTSKREATVSKVVRARIADLKGEAVRERLKLYAGNGAVDMLGALLLAFTFDNVRSPHGGPDIARALIGADGQPRTDVTEQDLCDLAAEAIGGLITFDRPDYYGASGRGAEWLAVAIDAELGRCDTPEILRGFPIEMLSEIAVAHGIAAHGTATVLRKRLTGALPDWRPATFGAPGPFGAPGGAGQDTDAASEDADDETDMMPYAGTAGPDEEAA